MESMISVKDASVIWGLTERRISGLCKEGKIDGAKKIGRVWMIPEGTKKPSDGRVKSGEYIAKAKKKPLPIGVSDYRLASTEYYYIDKTSMIKDFLDERPLVSLFTRPRRFGKTINMDMLRTFFEKSEEDTSCYFKDKKIWSMGEKYRSHQGKYPVIFITFKDIKCDTWEEAYALIYKTIQNEFDRHSELAESDKLSQYDKSYISVILSGKGKKEDLTISFQKLSQMLHKHHGVAPIIIIDEYDVPIQQGYMKGYYDKIIIFMRNLFSGGLKDNKHLSFGFMTGILRVAKESIFSGLNNLVINSVLDSKYSKYFGFTIEEVKEMAAYYGVPQKYDEICSWYDGYLFGDTHIFNPWSVVSYFNNNCTPRAFWQATGSNDIIGEILDEADKEIYEKLTSLINGGSFSTYIDTGVIYPQIKNDPSTIYSFLLVAGYLKVKSASTSISGDFMCEVSLPNKEIDSVYRKEILSRITHIIPRSSSVLVQEALFSKDRENLKEIIRSFLLNSVSSFDTAGENFYHGFMLGMCVLFGDYIVTSNIESGEGRYDICLKPKNKHLPGMIIELKAEKDISRSELKKLSEKALKQISDKKYDTSMKAEGIETIHKYGVAFCGKSVEISAE